MAFVKYENLTTPNEVIEKIHDYVKSVGSTITDSLRDDTDIFTRTDVDGKRFTFQDNKQGQYITLRSANGTQIFGVNDDAEQDIKPKEKHKGYHGIGMVVSEGYSKTQRWYNQFNAPLKFKNKEVQGVWMPISTGLEDLEVVEKPEEVEEPAHQDAPTLDYSSIDTDIPKVEQPVRPIDPLKDADKLNITEFRSLDSTVDELRGDRNGNRLTGGDATKHTGINNIKGNGQKYGGLYNFIERNRNANFCTGVEYPDGRITYVGSCLFTEPKLTKVGKFRVVFVQNIGNLYDPTKNTFSYYYNCPYDLNSDILNDCYVEILDKQDNTVRKVKISEINAEPDRYDLFVPTARQKSRSYYGVFNFYEQMLQKPFPKNGIHWIINKDGSPAEFNTLFTSHPEQLKPDTINPKFKVQGNSIYPYLITEEMYAYAKEGTQAYIDYVHGNSPLKKKYEDALAKYDTDMKAYQAYLNKVESMKQALQQAYNEKMVEYNKYLKLVSDYKEYLRKKGLYEEYLKKVEELKNTYTLYCNHIIAPTETFLFSLVKQNKDDKRYFQTTHLACGNLVKYEAWNGGAWFSGSSNRYMMQTAYQIYNDADLISDRWTRPLLSSGQESTTFVRCDIDEAPLDVRGHILWASSGTDNITGKNLSLPIRTGDNMNGQIPNYRYMQSLGRLEWGRNINTLNGITVDMPIFFSVKTDPEELDLYAAIGHVTGLYFLCTLNMQTAGVYERSYPRSGIQNQVFPMGRRRGSWGFDGIGIAQEDTVEE